MFCKFVVGIRHLFIKIIYTSRTGQMIVLYNKINFNNPDQKPDCIPCFLSIYARYPCKLSITCNLHFYTMCNLFPCGVLLLSDGGILHFTNKCSLPKPVDVFHSHIPLKIPFTETYRFTTSILLTSPPQNCIKSPHNSINHFDNHFDAYPKYPSTTI